MLGVAVRVRSAAEVVALDYALEAAALARARDLDLIARREQRDGDRVADVVRRDLGVLALRVVDAEGAQHPRRRLQIRLRCVTDRGLRGAASARRALTALRLARELLLAEAELDGSESGLLLRGDLDYRVRRGFDDGHGHLLPLLVEDVRHADFATDDSNHIEKLLA